MAELKPVETPRHAVVFVFNLLQDVNVLRPLVYLVAREIGLPCLLLVTHLFRQRDTSGLWQQELVDTGRDNWARIVDFEDLPDALRALDGMTGFLVAGSESNLPAHKPVHDLFRVAPPGLRKITLQHGFECVGFLQSRDQDLAHGREIGFAAEIICGWAEPARLRAVAPAQRHKLFVTGPSFLLHPPAPSVATPTPRMGLVCENMHSPRLNVAGNFKQDFFEVFTAFSHRLEELGESIALRPHPGGQYVLKQGLTLPANVRLSNQPMYRTDLTQYAFGISAPSSVLLDMVLAGIPTAVWQDDESLLDLGNYQGLTRIRDVQEWLAFREEAATRPDAILARQQQFLEAQGLLLDPARIRARYCALLSLPDGRHRRPGPEKTRFLFVANARIPTLQLGFLKPLARQEQDGLVEIEMITEPELRKCADTEAVFSRISELAPDVIVFCRYSGPYGGAVLAAAKRLAVPTLYHIDDDLLHIPVELGEKKHLFHSSPERREAIRELLGGVELVYCSTANLTTRLRQLEINTPIYTGKIYCAADVLREPTVRTGTRVGYMAIVDNSHNLDPIQDALLQFLSENPTVQFEFFGPAPIPPAFLEFGDRVTRAPKIEDYENFLRALADRAWDIGICPLADLPFNALKANTKWVEYTAVGAAVVASRGMVYDDCCAGDCGVLAKSPADWLQALNFLTRNPERRQQMVARAQRKLRDEYGPERLLEQVWAVVRQSEALLAARNGSSTFVNQNARALQC